MKPFFYFFIVTFVAVMIPLSGSYAGEAQVIPGAGPSTAVVQLFVEKFKNQPETQNFTFKVPPKSAKHAGGIKGSNKFIFGRTGRPLNEKEIALGKGEIFLGRVPVAFAIGGELSISTLTLSQLEDIFTGKIDNWKDVGGPDNSIAIIGREPNEALFSVLKKRYSFFAKAKFKFVVKKDNHVIDLLKKPQGKFAIGFGSAPNFKKASVTTVSIHGFSTGVSLGLVYDLKNKDHVLVKSAKAFAKSTEWANAVKSIGMLPPE